jgi:hypothetical protein
MAHQTTATKRAKAEAAKAEEFIEEAVTKASRRKKGAGWPCTAEDIIRERDTKGLSWRQVALNLDLGGPGQARKAYTDLTGTPHYNSQPIVRRAPRGSVSDRKVDSPGWNDDSDQETIEERLNGTWVPESGSGKDWRPAHWSGSQIVVRRTIPRTERTFDEEVYVRQVTEFTYGKKGDQPLQVWVSTDPAGAMRCFRVADIVEVR